MIIKVKICGITRVQDAMAAVDAGADALGFVFYPKSPRYVTAVQAAAIVRELPPYISTVGVFVDETVEGVRKTLAESGVSIAQLHGNESPDYIKLLPRTIKAARIQGSKDLDALAPYKGTSAFLLDAFSQEEYGGTGQSFDWALAQQAKQYGRVIVAGGLTPENVQECILKSLPYGVDVSSGVEQDKGIKDHGKIQAFVSAAKFVARCTATEESKE
jgi:phosphoribosylanthranilate isomerase